MGRTIYCIVTIDGQNLWLDPFDRESLKTRKEDKPNS
jgi:hypothetical protein